MKHETRTLTGISIASIMLLTAASLLPTACENKAPSAHAQMKPESLDMYVGGESFVEASVWVANRDLTTESGWQWKWNSYSARQELVFIYGDTAYWRRDGENQYSAGAFIRAVEVGDGEIWLKPPEGLPSVFSGARQSFCVITIAP
ncbi:MAG: hypothetical protein FJ020_09190 [Chloroflexi bacterium]|nr:hypothetical protein [Chloroflexota bacterium]